MVTTDKTAQTLFEDALKGFEATMKATLKLQEDTTRMWTKVLDESAVPDAWHGRMKTVAEEALALTQTNVEETLKLLESNGSTSLDLMKKAMNVGDVKTYDDAQARFKEVWEDSLAHLQDSAKTVAESNAEAMKRWNAYVRKVGETLNV